MGWGRGAGFRGSAGTSRWVRTYTEIAPSSFTSPRKKTPGRERHPAPRFVFGEEPWDRGAADCGEAPAPSEGTGTGLPGWGAASPPALRSTPSPNPGPSLHKRREEAARASAAAVEAHVRGEANPRRAGRSSHLRKEPEGRIGSQGRADRARRERGGVWRDRDQDSRLGLKHFCSQALGFQEKPAPRGSAAAGQPGRGARRWREESVALLVTEDGDVKNTRDVSCTLCIGSAAHAGGAARRPSVATPPRARRSRELCRRRAEPDRPGRGVGKGGATRTTRVLQAPAPRRASSRP